MKNNSIVYIVNSLGIGGSEKQLFYLVENLNKNFKIKIIKLNDKTEFYDSKIEELGVKIHKYDLSRGIFNFDSFRKILKMRSLILSYKPSTVHSWLFHSNLVNYILRILSTKYLMIVSKRGSNFWYTKKHFYVNKLIYSKSDYIITNSEYLKNEILSYNNVENKIKIIPNAIQVNDKLYRKKIDVNKINIGCIGRIVPEKRYEDILAAAILLKKKYDNILFTIIGGRGQFNLFKKQVVNKKIHNYFILKGEQENIKKHILDFDIFLMASSSEGMPNSIMEAMNYGKPIVATRVGSIPSLVEDNKNGLLIDPYNPKQIVEAISKLIDNQIMMIEFGENSYKMIKKMNISNMIRKIENIYMENN